MEAVDLEALAVVVVMGAQPMAMEVQEVTQEALQVEVFQVVLVGRVEKTLTSVT